ncbi:MAG: type IV toxin-antitoxin system AbiEi family antitoxin domain-containing protein [Candidatus Atribacteria bacterium]|nr:type IV toxin-antitoxin system AbiEi family antitoxin domain-containing protein [Candidatus Atribacteria bacterium]
MDARNNQKHTRIGIEMVRKLFEEGKRIFTIADARKAGSYCGMADSYVVEALYHLSNNGWIDRLKRGLYAISSSFPGMTSAHEFEIAMALVRPSAISHWSALHFHGMTEQIPQRVYVTTTQAVPISRAVKMRNISQRSFSREVNGILYEFIKVKPERFFGIKDFWVGEVKVTITDPERTLIDGLISPKHFGGWAEIYSAFESHISSLDLAKIIDYSLRLDVVIAKRLGWIMEKAGVEDSILQKLEAVSIRGYRVLDSSGPRKGHCNKRWMIQENLPGRMFR